MSVAALEEQIREFINRPRTQAGLLSDRAAWNTLCSALDVIGDTELALQAYTEWQPLSDDGERYLLVYGVLQVLLVQQNAVRFVCKSLSIDYSQPKEFADIRSIRSDSIGHPMEARSDKVLKSNFIRRMGLTQQCFTLMTVFSDARPSEIQNINISRLLEIQHKSLRQRLSRVIEELRHRDGEHRAMFKENKLEELFPKWIDYLITKF